MADAHRNFAFSTVATAPSPATSGTSLTVASGEGARFPTAPFNATVWPTGSNPTPSNAEIIRVTAISSDTLTISRAQESTTARSITVGDNIAATVTAKTFTDVETDVANRLRYQGAWSASAGYALNDIVSYNGVLYRCTTAVPAPTGPVIGSTGLGSPDTASRNISLPAGAVAGDVGVFGITTYAQSAVYPSGWTGYNSVATGSVFLGTCYKIVNSTDISNGFVTVPSQSGAGSGGYGATVTVLRGVSISFTGATSGTTSSAAISSANSYPAVVLNIYGGFSAAVAAGFSWDGTSSLTSGYSAGSGNQFNVVGYDTISSGASTSRTLTLTGTTATAPAGQTLAVPYTTNTTFQTGSFTAYAPQVWTRATTTATTTSLAATASDSSTMISLGTGYRLYSIATSKPARVRLYDTAAHQTADLSRAQGTDPSASAGVVLDYATTTANTVYTLSPLVNGANLEASPTANIAMTVTNNDTTSGAITISLVFLRTE